MGRYLDLLDLTREAARAASRDDPFALEVGLSNPTTLTGYKNCSETKDINFYYKVACYFSHPKNDPAGCSIQVDKALSTGGNVKPFCNGFNRYVDFDITRDDVVISTFTVDNQTVSQTWPNATNSPGHAAWWALSTDGALQYVDSGGNTQNVTADRWKTDCQGNNTGALTPQFTQASVQSQLNADYGAPLSRGYVAVEVYYCYHQVLAIPVLTNFIPDPMRIHAYTLMPLPNVQPTMDVRTPTPTP
jgi:hypothetical protein